MAIQGLRTTGNFVTDQRPKNWREGILMLYPNGKAPLTGLTSQMKEQSTDDPEYNWWEKEIDDRRLAVATSYGGTTGLATTDTSIYVTGDALTLKEGDLLYAEQTGEIMLVAADPVSDTVFTAIRGYAGTTTKIGVLVGAATGIGASPALQIIGSAMEEGSLAPTGINFDPTKRTNYCQIFRNTLEMTRTAMKTRLRTGDAVKEAKRECLEYHSVDMERAFFLGSASETTRNGKPVRMTGGLESWLQTYASSNITTVTGTPSVGSVTRGGLLLGRLEEYLYEMFRYGSSQKMAFCGNRALLGIQQTIRLNSTYQVFANEKEYGMSVTRLVTPYGELVLKTHPLFNQSNHAFVTGATIPYLGMDSWIVVLDMANIRYRYLTDSDTKYEPKLESNGMDGMKSGYLTECGLEVSLPKTHYIIKGVFAGATG
jgi:hypothetical protein